MNNTRTELFIDKNPDKFNPNTNIISFGSQFSNLMDEQLTKNNFSSINNPFGNIYNPISIFNALQISYKNEAVNEDLIVNTNNKWNHYDFHTQMAADSKEELISNLNTSINDTHNKLAKTDFLILTFGSAYVYKIASNKQVVANCHKTPTNHFSKTLLTTDEIIQGFRKVYKSLNHVKNIVLVVSPVMQMEDSLTLNAVSKSVLRLACHMIMSEFPHVKYFPAYEFLTSDLRGYENYNEDMITPTNEAMEYITAKFLEAYSE